MTSPEKQSPVELRDDGSFELNGEVYCRYVIRGHEVYARTAYEAGEMLAFIESDER